MRPGSPAPAFGRILGGLLVLGGLWHASAPWVLGYADVGRAAASDVASGLAVALLGAVRAAGVRAWPIAASAAVGGWILIAPLALGYTGVGAAANQALWSAAGVSAVAALAVLGWRANRADARPRPGPAGAGP